MKRGERIVDLSLANPEKLRASLEQLLLSKKNPFWMRAVGVVNVIDSAARLGWDYQKTWRLVQREVAKSAGVSTLVAESTKPVEGATTFSRNWARVTRELPHVKAYVCGPHVRKYLHPDDRCPVPVLLHKMNRPDPKSFLEVLVTEASPAHALYDYSLEVL